MGQIGGISYIQSQIPLMELINNFLIWKKYQIVHSWIYKTSINKKYNGNELLDFMKRI